jgi:hypothetical protein
MAEYQKVPQWRYWKAWVSFAQWRELLPWLSTLTGGNGEVDGGALEQRTVNGRRKTAKYSPTGKDGFLQSQRRIPTERGSGSAVGKTKLGSGTPEVRRRKPTQLEAETGGPRARVTSGDVTRWRSGETRKRR